MTASGLGPRRSTVHPDDVDVQCWCGARIVWLPAAAWNAGAVATCAPDCADQPPLSREPRPPRQGLPTG